jgi:transcriptional regulator of acetoin/glycerol metabolism
LTPRIAQHSVRIHAFSTDENLKRHLARAVHDAGSRQPSVGRRTDDRANDRA